MGDKRARGRRRSLFGFRLPPGEQRVDLWFSAFLASHVNDFSLNKISQDIPILCSLVFPHCRCTFIDYGQMDKVSGG